MSKRLNLPSALGIFLIGIFSANLSQAQTTWDNTGLEWTSGTSWVGDVAPANSISTTTNIAVFTNLAVGFNTVNLSSDRRIYGVLFTAGANAYTFTGSTLSINGAYGITNSSANLQTFGNKVINASANTTYGSYNAGGSLIFAGGIDLTDSGSPNNRPLTLGGSGNTTVSGTIANGGTATAGAVTVTATGTTTLSGNNTYDGLTTMNAAGGTLTLSGNNSGAGGGVTLAAGTLNINNNNALGTGALSLAGTGATINNTSGSAVVNAGNQAWAWTDGLAFGSSTNSAANNLNLGTGVVTASSTRTIALAGTGTKLTIGAVNITSASSGRTITANGVGNTLEMGGLTLSASVTPVTVTLAGSANIGVTGAIVNGTTPGNGLTVTATGTTTLSGNNTYTGLTTMNAAGGTLTLSGNNSGAGGGVTLTAGTLNINNNNALGSGAVTLTSGTINNTSGGAIANAVNNTVTWGGDFTFGTAGSTSLSNLNLGTGTVTASTSRGVTFAGTGTKLTIGAVNITSTSSGRTITANGAGNTLEMGGLTLSASVTPVTVTLAGSANIGVTGAIVNGTTPGNGLTVTATGTTTLSGNNTYTGTTEFQNGTTIISGNNSAAVGNVTIAGSTGIKPVVRLDNINAISSSSSLLGASGNAQIGTLDLRAAGNFSLNSFGVAGVAGNNMIFTNSSGSQKTLAFTAANNYITTASAGGRTLNNNSANLLLDFDGNIEIGGASAASEATTFAGVGNFNVDGNLLDTGTGLTRSLRKQGDGTLTLRGSANNRGSTLVEAGTLDLYGNVTASTDIVVSTSGTSANTGGRTANAIINVRSGASLLNSSTTTVWSRGDLIVNGTAGSVVVETNGSVSGSGTVGAVTLKSGSLLNPGNSPGTLTANSATILGNSTYNWQISNSGLGTTAGIDWDLLNVATLLDMSAITGTGTDKWNLVVTADGAFTGWTNNNSPYEYVFAQAASVSGFDSAVGTDVTSLFNITTSGITSLPNASFNSSGDFKVLVGRGANDVITLNLQAVPEPSTGSMLGLGLAGLVATRLFRRKSS